MNEVLAQVILIPQSHGSGLGGLFGNLTAFLSILWGMWSGLLIWFMDKSFDCKGGTFKSFMILLAGYVVSVIPGVIVGLGMMVSFYRLSPLPATGISALLLTGLVLGGYALRRKFGKTGLW